MIPVIELSIPSLQPSYDAALFTSDVTHPIKVNATKNAGQAPPIETGGTRANRTFQKMTAKCMNASYMETCSKMISSSLMDGPNRQAFLNYCPQVGF